MWEFSDTPSEGIIWLICCDNSRTVLHHIHWSYIHAVSDRYVAGGVEFCMGAGAVKSCRKTAGVPRDREERPPFIPWECREREWLLRESRRTESKRRSPPAGPGVTPGSLVGLLLLLYLPLSRYLCSMIWPTCLVHSWPWPWPLLHISSCSMDRLNNIFNFVFLSYWLQRDRDGKLRERDRTGIDHCGTRTGMGMTAVGTGRDREQLTSPVQISPVEICWGV